jgi:L-rhamnose mutarotase
MTARLRATPSGRKVQAVRERTALEKYAFTMRLKPGVTAEYERRHDALWPDLAEALRQAGIRDYSIFLAPDQLTLFAVLWRTDDHTMDSLPHQAVMKRWWAFMADLMDTNPDASPVVTPLRRVFHLD